MAALPRPRESGGVYTLLQYAVTRPSGLIRTDKLRNYIISVSYSRSARRCPPSSYHGFHPQQPSTTSLHTAFSCSLRLHHNLPYHYSACVLSTALDLALIRVHTLRAKHTLPCQPTTSRISLSKRVKVPLPHSTRGGECRHRTMATGLRPLA